MTYYTTVKNPTWADKDHTCIDCLVNFNHISDEFVAFTANPSDSMEYSKQIFDECVDGKWGEISAYVPPPAPLPPPVPTKEELMAKLLEIQQQLESLS